MKRIILIYSLFFVFAPSCNAQTTSQCPTLSLPAKWTLEKNFIHIQDQKWYVYQFWNKVHKPSGTDVPTPISAEELLSAQEIKFLDQLDATGCRYEVVKKDKTPAELVIKRMGK